MRLLWLVTLVACGRINFGAGDDDGGTSDDVAVRSGCMLQSSALIMVDAVTADDAGNIFMVGRFNGTFQVGSLTMLNTGADDRYVVSFAPDCTVRWAHQFFHLTTTGGLIVTGRTTIALDSQGSVVVASDWVEMLDAGDGMLRTANGGTDTFVAKLDASGTLVWVRQIGGTANDMTGGVVVASNDDVITAASFGSTVTVGTLMKTSVGARDMLLVRYASDGTVVWAERFGGAGDDYVARIAIDHAERVYAAGAFTLTTDFGTGVLTSNGAQDIFLARYGPGLVAELSKSYGSSLAEYGTGIMADDPSRVVIAGQFPGTVDFGGEVLTTAGGMDIYVVGVDASGATRWVRQLGGPEDEYCDIVNSDEAGNSLVTGSFAGTVDFGDGPRTTATRAALIVSLAPDGTTRWVRTIEASTAATGQTIGIDRSGGWIVGGTFNGTVVLGDSTLDSGAMNGAFVARIR